jgi:hypothetical protein
MTPPFTNPYFIYSTFENVKIKRFLSGANNRVENKKIEILIK